MTEIHRNSLESRCDEIKRLVINHCTSDSTVLGIDGLLDGLLVLYDECCNATLKKEKTIVEFLEYGKCVVLSIDCLFVFQLEHLFRE